VTTTRAVAGRHHRPGSEESCVRIRKRRRQTAASSTRTADGTYHATRNLTPAQLPRRHPKVVAFFDLFAGTPRGSAHGGISPRARMVIYEQNRCDKVVLGNWNDCVCYVKRSAPFILRGASSPQFDFSRSLRIQVGRFGDFLQFCISIARCCSADLILGVCLEGMSEGPSVLAMSSSGVSVKGCEHT